MIKKTNVDDRELERIHALMREVVRKSSRRQGSCLYRGEPECYPIVSSGLYRQCPDCEEEVFDIDRLEREIVERARQYTTLDGNDEIGVCTSLPTTPHLVVGRSACRVGVGPSLNRSWAQRSRPVVQAGRRALPGDESVVD